jgi:hypothetical protein
MGRLAPEGLFFLARQEKSCTKPAPAGSRKHEPKDSKRPWEIQCHYDWVATVNQGDTLNNVAGVGRFLHENREKTSTCWTNSKISAPTAKSP